MQRFYHGEQNKMIKLTFDGNQSVEVGPEYLPEHTSTVHWCMVSNLKTSRNVFLMKNTHLYVFKYQRHLNIVELFRS